ncbi:MAG: glycosyltransferase family 4 protein [Candidatus Shapirobacteria bacterium]
MKWLIGTPYYLPNISGITIYVQILAEELVKKGHQVTILTSRHDLKSSRLETINGVVIKRLWSPIKIGKGVIQPWFPIISLLEIGKNDIINCHLPQLESGWLAFWGRVMGKRVILTHHTDLSFWQGFFNKLTDSVVFLSQYIACLFANNICPYTIDYAKNSYLLKHFLPKIVAIYPPIKPILKNKKKLVLSKNKQYAIGFCGRVAKQKGFEVLIEATKYLDRELKGKYEILVVGPTRVIGEKYFDYLQSKYALELKDKFVFLGTIDRDDLSGFYQNLDLLVLPSDDRLESFGWVQIEAMQNGTPCVATDLPGMRVPISETGMGELFAKGNGQNLAEKIVKVLKNGKKYYQKNSKNLVDFDYQKTINEYEKLSSKN